MALKAVNNGFKKPLEIVDLANDAEVRNHLAKEKIEQVEKAKAILRASNLEESI